MSHDPFFHDKPPQKKAFDSLFAKIRDYSEQDTWSQGVRLTRNAEFIVDDRDQNEVQVRIKKKGQAISPVVTLYLEDQDWACDVDSNDDPCVNTIAAAIAINSGVGLVNSETQPASFIKYELYEEGSSLAIRRLIQKGDSFVELKQPLHEIAGGAHTGRISGLSLAVSKEDFAVESALGPKKRGIISPERIIKVLKALSVFPKIELSGEEIDVSSSTPHSTVEVFNQSGSFVALLQEDNTAEKIFTNGAVLIDKTLHPSIKAVLGLELFKLISPPGRLIPREEVSWLRNEIIPRLKAHLEVDESEVRYPHIVDEPPEVEIVMEKDSQLLRVFPRITYGSPVIAESDGKQLRVFAKNIHVERNLGREKQHAVKLKQELHLQLGREIVLEGENAVAFAQKVKGWKTSGKGNSEFALIGELQPKVHSEDNKILVSFNLTHGGKAKKSDVAEVFKAWDENQPYVPLQDGGWASIPENWMESFGERVRKLIEIQEANGKIPNVLKPSAAELLEDLGQSSQASLDNFRHELAAAKFNENPVVPEDIEANLRGYQKQGVHWLNFLKSAQLGALLADDMGLGKTLQTICALESPSLVIAPTSVLPAWRREIEQFRPSMSVNIYHGPNRSLEPLADVNITTYAIVRNDIEYLREFEWEVCVLDEAQNIKNPSSLLAKAVCSLNSKFRISLSGTPVENSLDDLWSQFHFLNPLLLGSQNDFRKRFKRKISLADSSAQKELKNRISPFILRRTKKEVLSELPPKTENILWVELSESEREIYNSIYAATKKEVLEKLDSKGGVFAALEALLRLRQACCHPALLPNEQADNSEKVELLLGALRTSVCNGHRALVFSQWTSFLDLVEPHLTKEKISFSRIDGSTVNREEVIQKFQSEDGPDLMLLSLKAGGVGVTLTAADHIFLLDSWWNPAVEEQATDRAHRIGQENPVFVYRLLAKNTIEENVLELQNQKRQLVSSIFSDSDLALKLNKEDILKLFQL